MTSVRRALHRLLSDPSEYPFHGEAVVREVSRVGANFIRLTLHSKDFDRYQDPAPGDAMKLHLAPGEHRVYTVRRFMRSESTLLVDILDHGDGLGVRWAVAVRPGDTVAFTGRRPEFLPSDDVDGYLFLADSAAVPAIAAIFESLGETDSVTAVLKTPAYEDRALVRVCPRWDVEWLAAGDSLVDAARLLSPTPARLQGWIGTETVTAHQLRELMLDRYMHIDDLKAGVYWSSEETWTESYNRSVERFLRLRAEGQDMTDPNVLEKLTFDDRHS